MFAETSGTAAPEPMRDSDAYRHAFQHAIACIALGMERVEEKIRAELQSQDPLVSEMLQYVAGLGGKRLRPALALLSARWLGKVTDETVRLATVVELVHTATLVHDDILDHATLRRHKPTVHVRWNVPSSVLIGDWLFTNAYRLANEGESTLPGRWVAVAAQRVCEGEIRQGSSIADWNISECDYVRMLEDKTGALCGVSAALGAWSAGAPLEVCRELEQFGVELGTAFQIFDDWLDVWGSSQKSGKTLGTDLSQLKPTLPILRTLDQMGHDARRLWIASAEEESPRAVEQMRMMLEQHDASQYTLQFARDRIGAAIGRLESLAIRCGGRENPAYQSLLRIAHASVHRSG
jgi:octaprenyl-diphosphate synthase